MSDCLALQVQDQQRLLVPKEKLKILLLLTAIVMLFLCPVFAYAADEPEQLTDLFKTKAFSGSMEVIYKLNWVGFIINTIISAFCFFGMILVLLQRVVTILYKASPSLWDSVHDLKANSDKKWAGFPGMAKRVAAGEKGTGVDVILGFLLMLLPDIQNYSDYREGAKDYNLDENDSIGTYMLKIAFPTILTIFFCTIGFSGTLWKGFGTCVEAMAVVADKAVNINFAGYVERLCNRGDAYSFSFDSDGSEYGSFAQTVAEDIYGTLIRDADDVSSDAMYNIGNAVDKWIRDNELDTLAGFNGGGFFDVTDDRQAGGLSCNVSKASAETKNPNALSINVAELETSDGSTVLGSSKKYPYITVSFDHKDVGGGLANYWEIGSEDSGDPKEDKYDETITIDEAKDKANIPDDTAWETFIEMHEDEETAIKFLEDKYKVNIITGD